MRICLHIMLQATREVEHVPMFLESAKALLNMYLYRDSYDADHTSYATKINSTMHYIQRQIQISETESCISKMTVVIPSLLHQSPISISHILCLSPARYTSYRIERRLDLFAAGGAAAVGAAVAARGTGASAFALHFG